MAAEPKPERRLTPEREAELRRLLGLDDTAFEEEIAQTMRCSTRTVQRFELPYIVLAGKRWYILHAAAAKLRRIARIRAPGADNPEGDLSRGVRHGGRVQRAKDDTD